MSMPRFRLRLSFAYDTTVIVTAPDAETVWQTPLDDLIDLATLDADTVEDLAANPIDWSVDAVELVPDAAASA